MVYVLDAADKENFNLAKTELHALMQKPAVAKGAAIGVKGTSRIWRTRRTRGR